MKRTFCAALALLAAWLALPLAASAQVVAAPAGGLTLLFKDGEITKVGDVFADIEMDFPWDSAGRHIGGLVALYGAGVDQGDFGGLGLRYYYHSPRVSVIPGFGVCSYVMGTEFQGVEETSILIGPELMLRVPLTDDTSDNVTAYVGIYPSVMGDTSFQVAKVGLRASLR